MNQKTDSATLLSHPFFASTSSLAYTETASNSIRAAWAEVGSLRKNALQWQGWALALWIFENLLLYLTVFSCIFLAVLDEQNTSGAETDEMHQVLLDTVRVACTVMPILSSAFFSASSKWTPKRYWAVLDRACAEVVQEIYLFRIQGGPYALQGPAEEGQLEEGLSPTRQRPLAELFLSKVEGIVAAASEEVSWAPHTATMSEKLQDAQNFIQSTIYKGEAGKLRFQLLREAHHSPVENGMKIYCAIGVLLAVPLLLVFLSYKCCESTGSAIFDWLRSYFMQHQLISYITVICAVTVVGLAVFMTFHYSTRKPNAMADQVPSAECENELDDGVSFMSREQYFKFRVVPLELRSIALAFGLGTLQSLLQLLLIVATFSSSLMGACGKLRVERWIPAVTALDVLLGSFMQWYALSLQLQGWITTSGKLKVSSTKFLTHDSETDWQDWACEIEQIYLGGCKGFCERLLSSGRSDKEDRWKTLIGKSDG